MKRIAIGLLVLLLLPSLAAAQAKAAGQKLILEFVDGTELVVNGPDRSVMKFGAGIFEGDPIPVGSTIQTGAATTAELKIKPNGTIIKLAKSTSFTVAGLAATKKDQNAFTLVTGKVRAVAAKGAQYSVSSQTTVCAVRGTDFGMDLDEGIKKEEAFVLKGEIDYSKKNADGSFQTISLGSGQKASAFSDTFEPIAIPPAELEAIYNEIGFMKLKESEVPEEAIEAEPEAEPVSAEVPPAEGEKVSAEEAASMLKPDKEQVESGLMKWIREALGMEIGSVTLAGKTYSKAIIQPNINLGKLKLGLYLPVIYTSDIFDPGNWYEPAGNNEWSFGADEFAKEEYVDGVIDAAKDVALKVKYLEFGQPLKDPFFFKIGNLKGLTLGHGLIMRNYANDTEFPALRRIGLNTGIDAKIGGFEALVNDLADPTIFGTRLFIKPIPNFAFALGLSGVIDIDPTVGLEQDLIDSAGDPMMIGAGLDMDFPFITSDLLSIRLFVDAATTLPYLQKETTGGGESGLRYDLLVNDAGISNWGAAGGLMGNVLFIDWRLEYRYYTGIFRSSYFDSTYDKSRGALALQYVSYLDDPDLTGDLPAVMGVYGEGGFSLMKDKLSLRLGYMWPWAVGKSVEDNIANAKDEFHARLEVKKGLIPIFDVYGSIFYDKHDLVTAIMNDNFEFLDANTTFGGELVVPVPKTPTLDLAVIFQTVQARDGDGNVIYKDGVAELKPSISIETRFHL